MDVVAVALRLLSRWGISTLDLALTVRGTSRNPSCGTDGPSLDLAPEEGLRLPFCVMCGWSGADEDMLALLLTELEKPDFRDSALESSEKRCLSSKLVTVRMVEFMRVGICCC